MSRLLRLLKWFALAKGGNIRNPFHAAALVSVRLGLTFLLIGAIGGYSPEAWRAIPIVLAFFAGLAFVVFGIPPLRRWMKRAYTGVDEDASS